MRKEIIALLKSSDPKDRANGIKQLVASGDPDALKILSAVYKKETHEGVKKLAAQAARQLKEETIEDSFEDEPAPVMPSSTKRDPEQAKMYLERAMTAVIDLKNDEAWEMAQKAFMANPDYAEDDYAVGLAAEITGAERSQAVATLMRASTKATAEKPKRGMSKNDAEDRVSWGKSLLWVGLYSVLVGIATYLPFAFIGDMMPFLIEFADLSAEFAEAGISPSEFSTGIGVMGIGIGIATVFMTFIGVLIQYGFIHICATMILGGKGYFSNLLYNLRFPLIAILIIQVVIFSIMIYSLFTSLPSDPAVWEAAEISGDYSAFDGVGGSIALMYMLYGMNLLISLGFVIWISINIGKTYDFGGVKGCLSIIISSIIMVVVIFICNFTMLSTVFAGASQF